MDRGTDHCDKTERMLKIALKHNKTDQSLNQFTSHANFGLFQFSRKYYMMPKILTNLDSVF